MAVASEAIGMSIPGVADLTGVRVAARLPPPEPSSGEPIDTPSGEQYLQRTGRYAWSQNL